MDDFLFGEQLGEGAYSRVGVVLQVVIAQKKDTKAVYAVKIVNKGFIQKVDDTTFFIMRRRGKRRPLCVSGMHTYCSSIP